MAVHTVLEAVLNTEYGPALGIQSTIELVVSDGLVRPEACAHTDINFEFKGFHSAFCHYLRGCVTQS